MEITNESIIQLANYFGEDPEVACEGASEFMAKAKERILALGNRIKEWIMKVITWIKEKFNKLIGRENVMIPMKLWKYSNEVIKDLMKFGSEGHQLFLTALNYGLSNSQNSEYMLESIQDKADMINKEANKILDTEKYKYINNYSSMGDAKTKEDQTYINYRPSTLSKVKSFIASESKIINGEFEKLSAAVRNGSNPGHGEYVQFKGYTIINNLILYSMSNVNGLVRIINEIEKATRPVPPKGAKTINEPAAKEEKSEEE